MLADINNMQQVSNDLGQFAGTLEADRLDRGIASRCEAGRAHPEVGEAVTFFVSSGYATYQTITAVFAALSDKVAATAANLSATDQQAADRFLSLLSFTADPAPSGGPQ
jgi:hypothetical protein